MSKDKYFRELMNSTEDSARDEIWENIKEEFNNKPTTIVQNSADTLAVNHVRIKHKRIVWVVCAVILVLGIALGSYYIWQHFNISNSRYCTLDDYSIEDTPYTVKQYITEQNLQIAYIEWYDNLEYVQNQNYKLNDTQEIICLYEEIMDLDGNFCYLYITDNHTELDALQQFVQVCTETITYNGHNLLYGVDSQISCVIIEKDGYKYYIKVEENLEQDFILGLVDKLLENK